MIERFNIDEAGKQARIKQVLEDVWERIWDHSAMAVDRSPGAWPERAIGMDCWGKSICQ